MRRQCFTGGRATLPSARTAPFHGVCLLGRLCRRISQQVSLCRLREEYNRGVAVGGLCTGAHILAAAGLLSGKRCAIHWENLPGFSEAFPKAEVYADLFEVDGNIYTCAGGTASLDMMLKLIGDDFDDNLVNRICEQALTDRVRNPHDRQRLPLRARLGIQNSKILTIIEMMEANLSEPEALIDVAHNIGLSRRRSNVCSVRKWVAHQRVIISKFVSTGPGICCCNHPCRLLKLPLPVALFRRRIFPSATANFTGVRRSRNGLTAKC